MTTQGPSDGTSSSIWLAVEKVGLPDKKYFKIGEVASLVGVEPHVLRYWQTQFPQVRPQKSRSGHRLYRRKDVETLLLVRELLHVQRFTIAGARQALRGLVKGERPTTGLPAPADGDTIPGAPARAYAVPPRPAATEVEAVDAVGFDDEDELRDALARQLVQARAGADVAELEYEAAEEAEAVSASDVLASAAQRPPALLGARVDTAAASLPVTAPAAAARGPSLDGLPPAALQPGAARTTTTTTTTTTTPSQTAARERARKEQLGFGFVPTNRGALEAARAEVLAMLEHLEREEATANRLRVRPVAAKS